MDKKWIEKEIEALAEKEDKNFRNYQETGIQRYQREYRKAQDLGDALRMALNAADEHLALYNLRAEIQMEAFTADRLLHTATPKPEDVKKLLKNIVTTAKYSAGYSPIGGDEE